MAYLLIVDDDEEFADSVAKVCKSDGHDVSAVHSTYQALTSIEGRRPDGILLDVMFPEDSNAGFKLAREIRNRFGSIPILMLTAINQHSSVHLSTREIDPVWLPVTDFVEKPIDFSVLKEKVQTLVERGKEVP